MHAWTRAVEHTCPHFVKQHHELPPMLCVLLVRVDAPLLM